MKVLLPEDENKLGAALSLDGVALSLEEQPCSLGVLLNLALLFEKQVAAAVMDSFSPCKLIS